MKKLMNSPRKDAVPKEQPPKNRLAVEAGRRGGKIGGKARAEKLTPERRREIARIAAQARWKGWDEKL